MDIFEQIENELNSSNLVRTENGALAHSTSGSKLVDLNFALGSMRSMSEDEILKKFRDSLEENFVETITWLFFSRDIRGGMGERRVFRIVINDLSRIYPALVKQLIKLIPIYGRWDDLWVFLDNSIMKEEVISVVKIQLYDDYTNYMKGTSISLLAKWLPSENASSAITKRYAKILRDGLKMSARSYRKVLSKLRNYLKVVEVNMSNNTWGDINYSGVPSKANILYKKAFLKHDLKRRNEFLMKLASGEEKINSSASFPYDIIHSYGQGRAYDQALESMWKSIDNFNCENSIVVRDGSGSMYCGHLGNTLVSAEEVATSLAIYCAEHCSGIFKDKFITFSESPCFVNLSGCGTLQQKIDHTRAYNEVANTNVEAVFDLILKAAIDGHATQEDLPSKIIIISDMEFDDCACCTGAIKTTYWGERYRLSGQVSKTLFDEISNRFTQEGYKMPHLVFWNVSSRTNIIPVKENEMGVSLLGGFSVNALKLLETNSVSPYDALITVLHSPRYNEVYNIIFELNQEMDYFN